MAIVDTLRMVSSKVMKRFPTYEHLVDAGLMTHDEVGMSLLLVIESFL